MGTLQTEQRRRQEGRSFAKEYGWSWSRRPFTLTALRDGRQNYAGMFPIPSMDNGLSECRCMDHAEFLRAADRYAAAIVAHVYDFEGRADYCAKVAAYHGLTLVLPPRPSWYHEAARLLLYLGPAGLVGWSAGRQK